LSVDASYSMWLYYFMGVSSKYSTTDFVFPNGFLAKPTKVSSINLVYLFVFYRLFCFEFFANFALKLSIKPYWNRIYHYFYYFFHCSLFCPLRPTMQCKWGCKLNCCPKCAKRLSFPFVLPVFAKLLESPSRLKQSIIHYFFGWCIAKELILAGKVKTTWKYGTGKSSVIRAWIQSSRLFPWHLGNADCDKNVTIVSFPHSSTSPMPKFLPFCIVL
jgi:hypothetical protein